MQNNLTQRAKYTISWNKMYTYAVYSILLQNMTD